MGDEKGGRASGEGRRELAGARKEGGGGDSASSIEAIVARSMSSISCSLSHSSLSGMWSMAKASRMVEPRERRQNGHGTASSLEFMVSLVTKHCMQK
jgi:hypothetical protein